MEAGPPDWPKSLARQRANAREVAKSQLTEIDDLVEKLLSGHES